jgi:hypothetical protein
MRLNSTLACLCVTLACSSPDQAEPRRVCFTHTGDDGLTKRLVDALEARIRESQQWTLGGCSDDDSLFVHMNAPKWSVGDSRNDVRPRVMVGNGRRAQPVAIDVRCWDDDLGHCVDVLVEKLGGVATVPES